MKLEVGKGAIIESDGLTFYITLLNEPSELAIENLNKAFQKSIRDTAEEKEP